jgi:hypothetical protein
MLVTPRRGPCRRERLTMPRCHSFGRRSAFILCLASTMTACSGGRDIQTGRLDAGETCEQQAVAYKAALAAARSCTPGAPNQCQVLVASIPAECPNLACDNQEFVNDNSDLELARGRWLEACGFAPHSCPGLTCPNAPRGRVCVAGACIAACPPTTCGPGHRFEPSDCSCVPDVSDAGTDAGGRD